MRALGMAGLAGLVAGLVMTGAAHGQTVLRVMPPGIVVASDLDGPYDDLPPPRDAPPPYARGYPAPLPPPGPPPVYAPSAYGPGLPIHEIYRIVRKNGYSPLGSPQNRGNVVTITVLDEDGEDGRLVIDAYSGRILRFVPAYTQGGRMPSAVHVAYGPPPATIPARPAVPLPKPRVTAGLPDKTGSISVTKPAAAPQIPPAPPAAVAAATQPVPALPQPAPKPAVTIQPTQAMPPAQGIE